ncbi:hypothetical protein VCRA2119O48_220046 [Vibrio crassostreae]|nr:hypothetical protein VCRA2119O48_220046 [Vibrio crassostreae]
MPPSPTTSKLRKSLGTYFSPATSATMLHLLAFDKATVSNLVSWISGKKNTVILLFVAND